MAIDFDVLFPRLGKLFFAAKTLNTSRLTTVPTEVFDAMDEVDAAGEALRETMANLPEAVDRWRGGGDALIAALATSAGDLIIQTVKADNPQEVDDLTHALQEVVLQMVAQVDSVDASTVAATITAGSSNAGNGTFLASTKRGDGKVNENILDESLVALSTDGTSFTFEGEVAEDDKLSQDWPLGSGANASVSVSALDDVLTNGGFETADTNNSAKPANWIVSVGTIGTTLKMTSVEVQTVIISSSPTSGSFVLHWVNAASKSQSTDSLAFNASGDDVQSALRALVGLEEVTVVTTGTTPNFTHTITFTGVTNPAQLTSTNRFDTGSIAHATSTAGSAHVYSGARSLEFDSDGSQLTEIRQAVTLEAGTVYAVNLLAKTDSVPAAGVLTVDLYDGSAIINDDATTANSFTISAPGLTTSFVAKNGFFRTPTILPPIVYLRIRISTGVSNTSSVFIDQVQLVAATELYLGGPQVAIFAGSTPFQGEDTALLECTNNRAGEFQEWFERAFDMREKGLLLPSDTGASETQADSLIA